MQKHGGAAHAPHGLTVGSEAQRGGGEQGHGRLRGCSQQPISPHSLRQAPAEPFCSLTASRRRLLFPTQLVREQAMFS